MGIRVIHLKEKGDKNCRDASKARIVGSHAELLCFAGHGLCKKDLTLLGRYILWYWH